MRMKTIAVFASGTGTNFEAIASACEDGRISARCALMVCDKPGAEVVEPATGFRHLCFLPGITAARKRMSGR